MNRKQSLRDHPIIKCLKNTQTTNRKTPPAEARFQQNYCYASLLKSHFGMGAPASCRFVYKSFTIRLRRKSNGVAERKGGTWD